MNYKVRLPGLISRRILPSVVLTAFLLMQVSTPLLAEDHYLAPGHPDGVALLAPPPVAGSAEQAADLALVQSVFKGRTPAETSRAEKEESLSFSAFASAVGPIFQPGKLPQTEALLKKVKKDIGDAINTPKNHWKRLRPYQLDAQLSFAQPETSFSYPSGHSTRGMVYALVLAELFPEKKDAILEIGRQIGWDRVLIGKHFLTDIRAGRELAQAIVREMDASPAFQRDLAAAKAEIKAASMQAVELQPAGK